MVRYLSLLLFIGLALGQSEVDPLEAARRAKAAAEKAIELKPDDASAYYNLGNAYYNQGKPELRTLNYKKAAKLGHQGSQNWLKKNGYDW